jgi:glucose-6-phosphate isomerase
MNEHNSNVDWQRYNENLLDCGQPAFTLDISRMHFADDFFESTLPLQERALADMADLEEGGIANPDEKRQVGHYWLRDADRAPTPELRNQIRRDIAEVKAFANGVHNGEIMAPNGSKFERVLLIGIGGSALGPQFVAEALGNPAGKMGIHFFDNTDPDGMDQVLAALDGRLATTLAVVISKSGGTAETRNGMLEAEAAYEKAGLDFAGHAVAVTGPGSKLDTHAAAQGWLGRFPMSDWVGGRTSIMSVVGLVPAALQGVDITAFLAGAAAMDVHTRNGGTRSNAAMLLALMWYSAGGGKGAKDMVVLPYKDRLVLFSKYLQQLVMESLGKEKDLDGKVVNQGIAVYGNKGSTDQHAYVQQLRDGVNNFFAVFIEVRKARDSASLDVEDGATSGDFLQGFLRGTREALSGNGRESMTISIPEVDAYNLGALIGLFERAVSFYASFVNINAYHQPGVEAGKKAAGTFLQVLANVRQHLRVNSGKAFGAEEIAQVLSSDPETVYHCLTHLAANESTLTNNGAEKPAERTFTWST